MTLPFGTSDGTLVENRPDTSLFGVSNTINVDQRLGHIPKAKRYPMPVMPPRFEPTFGRWNHYHLPSVDSTDTNDYYPRVTTIGKTLDDTEFLDKWKTNKLIEGLATYPEILDLVDPVLLSEGDPATMSLVENLVERARVAVGTSNAANFGTAVHAWTEAVDHGLCRIVDVPIELRAHVAAYVYACRSAGITAIPSLIERIIYNPYTGSAGRIDRISRMPDGTLVVLDVKTGKNIRNSVLGIGVQLAQYATSTHMLSEDGTHWETPPPMSQTLAIVAHIPSNASAEDGGVPCELVDIDLERAIADMMASVDVRERRSGKKNLITGVRYRLVSDGAVSHVESEVWGHIQSAQTAEHMRAIYAHYAQSWEPHFTEWGMARLRYLGIV